MKQVTRILITAVIFSAFTHIHADVILDHFEDFYALNPEQCHLGEAYGYSITKTWGEVDGGNGWWSPYMDEKGTIIANDAQESVDSTNGVTMIKDKAMHVYFKTHLSTCTFTDTIPDDYPFAGVYCDLMKDSLTYFDFTKLTIVSLRLKGSGNIRILFQTKDVYEQVDTTTGELAGWGYYGVDISMDSTFKDWQTKTYPVGIFKAERYSPADVLLWKWAPPDSGAVPGNTGREFVKGFAIQAVPDDSDTTDDSCDVWVDDIVFKGLDYQECFGFEYDTVVAIIHFPENNLKMNINITPNQLQKSINISYDLEKNSAVYIAVFDTKGKTISELINTRQSKGPKKLTADLSSRNVPSGVYFITFRIGEFSATRKFSFIK